MTKQKNTTWQDEDKPVGTVVKEWCEVEGVQEWTHNDFVAHLKAQGIECKGTRQFMSHVNAGDWHHSTYRWTIAGKEYLQSVSVRVDNLFA